MGNDKNPWEEDYSAPVAEEKMPWEDNYSDEPKKKNRNNPH